MENEMAPKDQPRGKRVPVLFTEDERAEIQTAAKKVGLGISTFIRVKTLEAIRDN